MLLKKNEDSNKNQLEQKVAMAASFFFIFFGIGIVLYSINNVITGFSISNVNNNNNVSFSLGIIFFIIGILGMFFSLRKKKKLYLKKKTFRKR